jgi:dsDNA-specific endonuclease/ATPase MutS2
MIFDEEKRAEIEKLFRESTDQSTVLIEIYKTVFPDWDKIDHIDGWPKCGKVLWIWICDLFIAFDHEHHPKVVSGGLWINSGFGVNEDLADYEVSTEGVEVVYFVEREDD